MTTLNDFITEEAHHLEAFEDWWEHMNEHYPQTFPLYLEPEQWTEEYKMWKICMLTLPTTMMDKND